VQIDNIPRLQCDFVFHARQSGAETLSSEAIKQTVRKHHSVVNEQQSTNGEAFTHGLLDFCTAQSLPVCDL